MPDYKSVSHWTKIIRPHTGWFNLRLRETWDYRDLIKLFIRRDFVAIYKQTILGPLWFLLQPLMTTLMYTVVFGIIASISTDGAPFIVFYMSGTIIWNYFAACLNQTSNTFVTNANIFGKVYFPRLTVPVSVALVNLITFGIQFMLFLVIFLYYWWQNQVATPNPWLFSIPLLVLQMGLLGIGVGILISSLTTKYRDLTYVMGFAVQLWMFATPIVYPTSLIPGKLKWLAMLNPAAPIVDTFRYAFLGKGEVSKTYLLASVGVTIVIFLTGIIMFNRVEKSFMDTV
ncbi:MAG: ABC transporter permease [Dissulfurispiraceae bacterium]|jgi:lipopolysaccharide transport system permease protein